MKLKSAMEIWDEFWRMIKPPNPSQVQLTETRRAFFAGMAAMVDVNYKIGHPSVPAEEALKYLERLQAELKDFARSIGKGDR